MSIQKFRNSDKQKLNLIKEDKNSVTELKSENDEIINFLKNSQEETQNSPIKLRVLKKLRI